jgi:hypothetical protein
MQLEAIFEKSKAKQELAPTQSTISRKEMEDKFDIIAKQLANDLKAKEEFIVMNEYPSDLIFYKIQELQKEIDRLRGWTK